MRGRHPAPQQPRRCRDRALQRVPQLQRGAKPDRDDRVQLATLSRVATRAGCELGAAVNSLSELPVDEQREALAELGDLLWRNRAGASKASRRIAALLLEQGLERVGA